MASCRYITHAKYFWQKFGRLENEIVILFFRYFNTTKKLVLPNVYKVNDDVSVKFGSFGRNKI